MAVKKYFMEAVILLLVSLILLQSCVKKNAIENLTPAEAFEQAETLFKKGKFLEAEEIYKQIKDFFPYSSYAIKAELRLGDLYYKQKNYDLAVQQYSSFRELHPSHESIPYVTFKIGMCYYQQILSPDRDQYYTRMAIREFSNLISLYPHSKYASAAKDRIARCLDRLAEHEFIVGKYYFRKKKYKAALERFKAALRGYPSMKLEWKIVRYIRECEKALQNEKIKGEFQTTEKK